jgi:elongation factor Ts
MTEITASLVKALREATGVAMMDCKKALTETAGDIEAAKEWLRKKGLSNASKKSDRTTADGVVAAALSEKSVVLLELNSETDFVAKNEKFVALANTIANEALKSNLDIEALNSKFEQNIVENIATLGENIKLARVAHLNLKEHGAVNFYIHNAISSNCGKIGVAVAIESDKAVSLEPIQALARQIGMHIAAAKPEALDVASLDKSKVDNEKRILTEQAQSSGKPANVIEKMIEGRIRKFYEEVVLLEQSFVINPDKKVSEAIADLGKELGCNLKLTGYLRFALGA